MSTIDDLTDAPWDVVEFLVMIDDLKKFLDLAGHTLDSQFDQEIRRIERTGETEGYEYGEDDDRLRERATRQFTVMLPLLARYGAVASLATSVEWSVRLLDSLLRDGLIANQAKSEGNATVRRLSELNALTKIGQDDTVSEYGALVHVRNCIVHNAGIVKGYKHEEELPKSVALLTGTSLRDLGFLGEQVWIDRGALDRYIDRMDALVVKLFIECYKQGHMRPREIRVPTD